MAADQSAAAFSRFNFHPAIVQAHKAVNERQSKPCAGPMTGARFRLEPVEYFWLKICGDSRSAVGNIYLHIIANNLCAENDRSTARRIFQGIGQQVENHLPDAPLIQNGS